MLVKDIMTTDVITIAPHATIREVAELMRKHAVSGLPVVDAAGKVVGIVTEIDLLTRHAPPRQPQYIPLLWGLIPMRLDDYSTYKEQIRHILAVFVEQLMTSDPATIRPGDTLEHAAELMVKPGHRSLPVVEKGKLVGIVTRTDLVRVIEELEMGEG
jgi:CBS domain-containing protein